MDFNRCRGCRCCRRGHVFGFRQCGLLLDRLQLELRVAASLLSTLHLSVRLPAVLRVFPAKLLWALLALEFVALSGSTGRRPRQLLIAFELNSPAPLPFARG
jgi:hypothetical protein